MKTTSLTSVVRCVQFMIGVALSNVLLDGYDTPASNRTEFPLTGGFYAFNSEHPKWTGTLTVPSLSCQGSLIYFSLRDALQLLEPNQV